MDCTFLVLENQDCLELHLKYSFPYQSRRDCTFVTLENQEYSELQRSSTAEMLCVVTKQELRWIDCYRKSIYIHHSIVTTQHIFYIMENNPLSS
jgi:hypothetical protein